MKAEGGFGGTVVVVLLLERRSALALALGWSAVGGSTCLLAVPSVLLSAGAGAGAEADVGFLVLGAKGVVFVGAVAMTCSINSGTRAGVTLSTIVKAGRSSTVVGLSFES